VITEQHLGMAGEGEAALAGGCTIVASAVATWHIYKHLCNYTEPTYQRYTIRILFMIHVPFIICLLNFPDLLCCGHSLSSIGQPEPPIMSATSISFPLYAPCCHYILNEFFFFKKEKNFLDVKSSVFCKS